MYCVVVFDNVFGVENGFEFFGYKCFVCYLWVVKNMNCYESDF